MKRNFLVLAFLTVFWGLNAQDIHFSQFYKAPLHLNPALTGVMNCNTRILLNYRNQWATILKGNAFNTYALSYDQKIPVGRTDYFGIGGFLYRDVAGSTRYGKNSASLSLSYSKKIAGYRERAHYLVIGANGGINQTGIDPNSLKFPDQHNGNGGYDPTKGGETLERSRFLSPDVSAGLLWFSVFNKNNNFYVGASMAHLNQANQSFYKDNYDPLYTKLTFHAGGQFSSSSRTSWLPGFIFLMQGPHREFNFGTSARFTMGNTRFSNQSFQFGLWYRLGMSEDSKISSDALILSSRINYENFNFGFSYDITLSSLGESLYSSGAFEFSVGYEICGSENRGVYCPKF